MARTRRIKDQHAEGRVFTRRTIIAGAVVAVCFAIPALQRGRMGAPSALRPAL